MRNRFSPLVALALPTALAICTGLAIGSTASPLDEKNPPRSGDWAGPEEIGMPLRAVGDPVDFDAAMQAGAGYLRQMQADVTEDNAGNGTDGIDESPDDPDDGGWDWVVNTPAQPFFTPPQRVHRISMAYR